MLACLCHLIFCELGPGLHIYILCNSIPCIHEPFGHAVWGREASVDAVEVIGVARSVWTKQPLAPFGNLETFGIAVSSWYRELPLPQMHVASRSGWPVFQAHHWPPSLLSVGVLCTDDKSSPMQVSLCLGHWPILGVTLFTPCSTFIMSLGGGRYFTCVYGQHGHLRMCLGSEP